MSLTSYEVTIHFGKGIRSIPPYRFETNSPVQAVANALEIEHIDALELAAAGGRVEVHESD